MSSLTITVNGTPQVVQLGTLSAAVNEQITQAVSSASASASAASASATAAAASDEDAQTQAANAAESASAAASAYSEIANGTAPSAGALTGSEIIPMSRGSGLIQTTAAQLVALAGSNAIFAGSISALQAISVTSLAAGTSCIVAGYSAYADGGGGIFVWEPSSTRYADGGVTIAPNSGSGRWIRLITEKDGWINVLWFGANRKASGNTTQGYVDSTTAITNAALVCKTFKGSPDYVGTSTSILKLYFPAGGYAFNFITGGYADFEITGDGMGTVRLYQNNSQYCPPIYFQGGGYTTAMPYGGCNGIEVYPGQQALGAAVYIDTVIDQGANFDWLWVNGTNSNTTVGLDAISCHDFLNSGSRKNRFDGVGGWAVHFRGYKGREQLCTTTSGYHFASTAINTSTGGITVTNMMPLEPGAAVCWFTTGVTPTANDTGTALSTGDQGVCYFVALGSTASTIYLCRTRANALAGTSILTFSAAGSGTNGLVVFRANFDMILTSGSSSGQTNSTQFGYNNDKGVIIATSVVDSSVASSSANLASGFLTSITTNNGSTANSCTHVVFFAAANGATLPTGISPGVAYFPAYIDGQTCQIYNTPTNAAAAASSGWNATTKNFNTTTGQINPSGGSGEIVVLYGSVTSIESFSHHVLDDFTYDNANAPTTQTVNGTACGGYGLLCADFQNFQTMKGGIEFKNARVEINKSLAVDAGTACLTPNLLRVIGENAAIAPGAGPTVAILLENLHFALNTSLQQFNINVLGTTYGEIAYMLRNVSYLGMATVVQNDQYNMVGAIQGKHGLQQGRVLEAQNSIVPNAYMDNTAVMKWGGMHRATGSNTTSSIFQVGDSLFNPGATGPHMYVAINAQGGFGLGSGSTSAGITVNSTTGSNVFTVASGSWPQQLCPGSSVSIATALDGINPLVGILGTINALLSPVTFTLLTSAGAPQNAGASVSSQAVTYSATSWAQVDKEVVYSDLTVSWTSLAAGSAVEVAVTGLPTGTTFSTSTTNPPRLKMGIVTTKPSGIVVGAPYVASSSSIKVTVFNGSGSSSTSSFVCSISISQ